MLVEADRPNISFKEPQNEPQIINNNKQKIYLIIFL